MDNNFINNESNIPNREYEILANLDEIINKMPYLFNNEKENDKYFDSFSNRNVPRVTKVIDLIMDKSGLLQWANHLGFKSCNYNKEVSKYSSIGSNAHKMIDYFLKNDKNGVMSIYNNSGQESINAFYAFVEFYKNMISRYNIEIVFQECTLISKYFGGTIDALYKVDGKYWLIDYKTSKNVKIDHLMQLAAYSLLLEWIYNIKIDRAIILKLEKYSPQYTEYSIDMNNVSHENMFRCAREAFLTGLLWYYNYKIVNSSFTDFIAAK